MRKFDKKDRNYVIVFATIILVLSVAYATFAQPLAHRLKTVSSGNGTTWWNLWWLNDDKDGNSDTPNKTQKAINDGTYVFGSVFRVKNTGQQANVDKWDVGFVSAVKKNSTGSASEIEPPVFTKLKSTFNVVLYTPGDSITYEFSVKNSGNLDAKVSNIEKSISSGSDNIIFKTEGMEIGDIIKVGETKSIKVTALFDPNYQGESINQKRTIDILINYSQNS